MPKLSVDELAARRRTVETAALRLFTMRGFHGVGLRDIAKAAGMSLGNIYVHFDSKEAIFRALLSRLYGDFRRADQPIARFFAESRFPDDIEAFGQAIGEMVRRFRSYLLLVFVDVVEFRGRHIALHYRNLVPRFRALLAPRFDELRRSGYRFDVDPALAFAAIYMQYFNFFIVEHLFRVRRHFGATESRVVSEIARLFRHGVCAGKEITCSACGSPCSSPCVRSSRTPAPVAPSPRRRSRGS
jgi:AcrR family transcriptional regulator